MNLKELNKKLMRLTGGYDESEKDRFYASAAVDDPKKIAYFTARKLQGETEIWDIETRKNTCIMTKPGKFFRHINPDLTDSELQDIVAAWFNVIALDNDENEFDFLLSDKIVHYYDENRYYGNSGSLGSSCMRDCSSYIEFYDNYDVSILVLKNADDKITGRALVWHNVFFSHLDGRYDFMDRVYVNDDNDAARFFAYAGDNRMVRKSRQSYSDKQNFYYNGESFFQTICIDNVDSFDIQEMEYPYLDTLSSMDSEGNLCNEGDSDFYIDLTNTDGTCSDAGGTVCADCGDRFNSDCEGVYIEDHGSVCDSCADNYSYCESCETYVPCDDICRIDDDTYVCEYCRGNDYTECSVCGEYHLNEKNCESEDGTDYCEGCYCDNFTTCELCESELNVDDIVNTDAGNCLCLECYNNKYTRCDECGDEVEIVDTYKIDGKAVCPFCLDANHTCQECGIIVDELTENETCMFCQVKEIA